MLSDTISTLPRIAPNSAATTHRFSNAVLVPAMQAKTLKGLKQ